MSDESPRLPTRLRDLPADHLGRQLLTGMTPSFAARVDPRFSYSLFVPEDVRDDEPPLRLWVCVHGTGRRTELYVDERSELAELARQARAVVLAPLFPAGIGGPDAIDNYHDVAYGGIRFDQVLLGMVDDVAHRWNVDGSAFFLHGFSGGGQFSHRFLYLHPERLTAISLGAPGRVTLPDADAPWPQGLADVEAVFGRPVDAAAVAAVPMQVLVGTLDARRIAHTHALAEALEGLGATVRLDDVDGVGHDGAAVVPVVLDFLKSQL